MDKADAQRQRFTGVAGMHALAVEKDFALVRGDDAAQHLHQRGLAGAVFSNENMHFALAQVEIHLVEYLYGGIADGNAIAVEYVLGNALHFKQCFFRQGDALLSTACGFCRLPTRWPAG